MIECKCCQRTYRINVKKWPLHCRCEARIYQDETICRERPVESIGCKHFGKAVGKYDCGCGDMPDVHACAIHGLCTLRKIKPGSTQTVVIDGERKQHNLAFCAQCSDHDELFSTGSIGFVSSVFFECGGTETWHRMLLPRLSDVAGFVTIAEPHESIRQIGVDVAHGIEKARYLASVVDTLIVWGEPSLEPLFTYRRPKRVIAVHHGDETNTWSRQIIRSTIRDVDLVVAVNKSVAEKFGFHHIPNAIDPDRIAKQRNPEKNTVLWCHRLSEEKRPMLAVEIAREMPDWQFTFAGDGTLREQFLDAIQGVDNIVYAGAVSNPAEMLERAAVFLSTTEQEGFGYSIGEAAASGCPVVSTPTGIAPDVADQLVDSDDVQDWVAAIRNAGSGERGKQRCLELYSHEKFVQAWKDVLGQ